MNVLLSQRKCDGVSSDLVNFNREKLHNFDNFIFTVSIRFLVPLVQLILQQLQLLHVVLIHLGLVGHQLQHKQQVFSSGIHDFEALKQKIIWVLNVQTFTLLFSHLKKIKRICLFLKKKFTDFHKISIVYTLVH